MTAYSKKEILLENPISVSEFISLTNRILSGIKVKIIGETGQVKRWSSGHVYFSLKDEETGDLINCVIWKSVYQMYNMDLEEGMKVVISGTADIYGPRGTFSFKVKTIKLAGEGALKKAYLKLKEKLSKEGLFDEEKKRSLPRFPKKIGLITSREGAAIHDFLNNLGKFGFTVYLCHSKVEGEEAVKDLIDSIRLMKKKDLDVLAIVRGGGSLESLMAFDNETLVREVASFPIPVVAGIGHHQDVPLVALASDLAESTPTAAADRISKSFYQAREELVSFQKIIEGNFRNNLYTKKENFEDLSWEIKDLFRKILDYYKERERKVKEILSQVPYLLREKEIRMENNLKEIFSSFKKRMKVVKESLIWHKTSISNNDPKRQLSLGYAIIRKGNKIIKSVKDVSLKEELKTSLSDGEITSQVKKINKKKNE